MDLATGCTPTYLGARGVGVRMYMMAASSVTMCAGGVDCQHSTCARMSAHPRSGRPSSWSVLTLVQHSSSGAAEATTVAGDGCFASEIQNLSELICSSTQILNSGINNVCSPFSDSCMCTLDKCSFHIIWSAVNFLQFSLSSLTTHSRFHQTFPYDCGPNVVL